MGADPTTAGARLQMNMSRAEEIITTCTSANQRRAPAPCSRPKEITSEFHTAYEYGEQPLQNQTQDPKWQQGIASRRSLL
jgi:hypothetical protein